MKGWRVMRLVTMREIRERMRSKVFILSSLLTVVLVLALVFIPVIAGDRTEAFDLGLVGSGNDGIVAGVERLLDLQGEGDRIETEVFSDMSQAVEALAAGQVEAVLVDGSRMVIEGTGGFFGSELEGMLQEAAALLRLESLLADPESAEVLEVISSQPLMVESLSGADEAESAARGVVAYAGLMLMYIAVLTYGTWTLTGVTEEKSSRVVEVLLATVEPRHLLAGKVLGIGLLGVAQFTFTIVVALIGVRVTGSLELPELPVDSIVMLVIWFILGFAIYSLGFGAAGALANRTEDAQSTAAPFTILAVGGFFASIYALDDPNGPLAIVTSYLPPIAPFVVPLRFALRAMPWWEVILSIVVAVTSMVLMLRLGGRVYAGGLLRTGAKVRWRDAFRASDL